MAQLMKFHIRSDEGIGNPSFWRSPQASMTSLKQVLNLISKFECFMNRFKLWLTWKPSSGIIALGSGRYQFILRSCSSGMGKQPCAYPMRRISALSSSGRMLCVFQTEVKRVGMLLLTARYEAKKAVVAAIAQRMTSEKK